MLGIFRWRQKRGLFLSVYLFLKEGSGATRLKKEEKWRNKNRFGPNGKIPNMLLGAQLD